MIRILPFLFGAALAFGLAQQHPATQDVAQPGTVGLEQIRRRLAQPEAHRPFVPEAPLGLPSDLSSYIPADNPLTPAKVELGRQLYFDKRLSRDGSVSCATCHDPAKGWTDQAPVSTGIAGQKGGRSAPTVMNRVLGRSMFWDGRAASLEDQALGPIANPIEMGFTVEEAVVRLNEIPGYRAQFEAVFGSPATAQAVGQAIAAFERTILAGAAPNDYYERAVPWLEWTAEEEEDEELKAIGTRVLAEYRAHALSEAALRGRALFFGKAQCTTCHVGADLTDEQFHNLGIGIAVAEPADGLMKTSGKEEDWGKYKTPTVRNIAATAPYFHDGSARTLMDVMRHYNQGGTPNKNLSKNIFPLGLSEQEMQDVVAFMEQGLTGFVTQVETPSIP